MFVKLYKIFLRIMKSFFPIYPTNDLLIMVKKKVYIRNIEATKIVPLSIFSALLPAVVILKMDHLRLHYPMKKSRKNTDIKVPLARIKFKKGCSFSANSLLKIKNEKLIQIERSAENYLNVQ